MIPAWDYEHVCREIGLRMERSVDRNGIVHYFHGHSASDAESQFSWIVESLSTGKRQTGQVTLAGLLFAPPETVLTKNDILPSIDYFHHRSGEHIDVFCAGYRRFGSDAAPRERPVSSDSPPWFFSPVAFDRFRGEIEQRSRWRYSGDVDLLLMNAVPGQDGHARLDFTSAIACDLHAMLKDEAIRSVRRFFEDLFRFTERASGTDPAWGFSDVMTAQTGGSALKTAVLSLLPGKLGAAYRRAEHFTLRDISVRS